MIILDINQVMLSNLMMQMGSHSNMKVEVDLVRHMVLNSIRMYNNKFRDEFGDIVVACDNRKYWRKEVFPYYKANRKKDREKSDIDWQGVFDAMHIIRNELSEFFPYRVIDIDGAEADDVIGTLVTHFGNDMTQPILIMSADKDFIQLHHYMNVKQYDPIRKKYIQHNNPSLYMKEHIIRGDSGDGIPNILSADNCLVMGVRQKPIRQDKLDDWIKYEPEVVFRGDMLRNYKRNQQLIDLTFTPDNIREQIIKSYEMQAGKTRSHLFDYFVKNKLRNLIQSIGEY